MRGYREPWKRRITWAAVCMSVLLFACSAAGCGGSAETPLQAAGRFIDACNNLDAAGLLSTLSAEYRKSQEVPDSLTPEQLGKALKPYTRLSLDPEQGISVEGEGAVIILAADSGEGTPSSGQTLVLARAGSAWKVGGCTALNWAAIRTVIYGSAEDRAAVETQLKYFLNACIDSSTPYIYDHLSATFLEQHNLSKPWTASEFAGIFGTARSYDFSPGAINFPSADEARVNVTIEFGTRGNLQSESGEVVLVRDKGAWKVDKFPFFLF